MKKRWCLLSLILVFSSCSKADEEGVFCTLEYRMFTLTLSDSSGNPVFLDRHHTLDKNTGDTILNFRPASQPFCQDSTTACYSYFLDDISLTTESGKNFVFEGMIGDSLIVRQDFTMKHDKCHVIKVSGKTELIANN